MKPHITSMREFYKALRATMIQQNMASQFCAHWRKATAWQNRPTANGGDDL